MLDLVIHIVTFILGLGIGRYGLPALTGALKAHAASHAVAAAKKLVASQEAAAKALAAAQALIAAQPPTPPAK
jgi:hypothetical protein